MSGRKILSVLLALVVAFGTVFPSVEAKRDDLLDRSLYRLVEGLKQDPATRGMVVGYEAVSLDRGEVMASLRAEKTFVPGSVLQLLTGAAVLDAMPEGMSDPHGSVCGWGSCIRRNVEGGHHPQRVRRPFPQPPTAGGSGRSASEEGIRRVRGDLVVDDAVFDDERLGTGWMWDDEPFPFSAQIGALSVDGNTVTVRATPGALGKPPASGFHRFRSTSGWSTGPRRWPAVDKP